MNARLSRSTLFPYTTLFRSPCWWPTMGRSRTASSMSRPGCRPRRSPRPRTSSTPRSEEHTSELQSHSDLVCRLLLEKKKETIYSVLLECILIQYNDYAQCFK